MSTRHESRLLKYAAILCLGLFCPGPALAQYGNEATLGPQFSATLPRPYTLSIPAVRVGNRFYKVTLDYRPPSWILTSAAEITLDGKSVTSNRKLCPEVVLICVNS